ncbi:hypothetical protein V6245_03110 [Salinibacterium amurskyense]|uniref:hypothetical protein n=1 Tax=Salinibacterium amurskyense TaxID=205941 RepID=UPI00311DE652
MKPTEHNRHRVRGVQERLPAVAITVLSVALALGACTPLSERGDESPEASSPTGQTSTEGAVTAPSLEEQLDFEWSTVIARFPDAVRPDVPLIRYIDLHEWAPVQAECMNAEGFPDVSATPDGGLSSGTIPPGQEEAYAIAAYVCAAQYPRDPKYLTPWTDERLGMVYDYYIDKLIPCLKGEGYEPPDPPSRVTFIDGYDGWSPYLGVVGYTQDEWFHINEICPQWPEGLYD